jgi:hypothetical protein
MSSLNRLESALLLPFKLGSFRNSRLSVIRCQLPRPLTWCRFRSRTPRVTAVNELDPGGLLFMHGSGALSQFRSYGGVV